MSKSLKQWQTTIHKLAVKKGWYDQPRSPLEVHMLIVSEVAEATEAVRKGAPDFYIDPQNGKPEGERAELADTVIRILDYYESKGWDLEQDIRIKHSFNQSRPYRHGKKL